MTTTRQMGTFYNQKKAASELRKYREKGPIPSTKALIDALVVESVEGATVLDIGGGIGAVQHELLAAGAAHVTSVDASASYLEAAREEAIRRGVEERVTYRHGDFVELAESVCKRSIRFIASLVMRVSRGYTMPSSRCARAAVPIDIDHAINGHDVRGERLAGLVTSVLIVSEARSLPVSLELHVPESEGDSLVKRQLLPLLPGAGES